MKFQPTQAHVALKMSMTPVQYAEPLLVAPLAQEGIFVETQETTTEDEQMTMPYPISSLASIFLTERYFAEIYNTPKRFAVFAQLIDFIKPQAAVLGRPRLDETSRFALFGTYSTLSIFYTANEEHRFGFVVEVELAEKHFESIFSGLVTVIQDFEKGEGPLYDKILKVKPQNDGVKYFQYPSLEGFWTVLDPVKDLCDQNSQEYRQQRDKRVYKPTTVFNEENFLQYFIWDNQWKLLMDGVSIILPRPNDIGMYAKIAFEKLTSAKDFYKKEIVKRKLHIGHPILSFEETAVFYNYFEQIIVAIVLSYTAIEAFANTCIVEGQYTRKRAKDDKTMMYNKTEVERTWTLPEKLIFALQQTFPQAPLPNKEKWWSAFKELEQMRNEIIHTKQTDSRKRYSKLLAPGIFKQVEVFDKVIRFFGPYIQDSKYPLINEYPYDFGADGVTPSCMSNEDFVKTANGLRGN